MIRRYDPALLKAIEVEMETASPPPLTRDAETVCSTRQDQHTTVNFASQGYASCRLHWAFKALLSVALLGALFIAHLPY